MCDCIFIISKYNGNKQNCVYAIVIGNKVNKQMNKSFSIIFTFIIFTICANGQVTSRKVKNYIYECNLKALTELIEDGFNIDTTFKNNETLLHYAAYDGNLKVIKLLVDNGADLNIQDEKYKKTPLLISTSSYFRNDSISEYIINNGANLNIVGQYCSTALRNTLGFKDGEQNFKIFKLLIDKGVDTDLNCDDCCNRTVFLWCCERGTPEMLKYLIAQQVDINQVDCNGENGLIFAIYGKKVENIDLLIKAGIDSTDFHYEIEFERFDNNKLKTIKSGEDLQIYLNKKDTTIVQHGKLVYLDDSLLTINLTSEYFEVEKKDYTFNKSYMFDSQNRVSIPIQTIDYLTYQPKGSSLLNSVKALAFVTAVLVAPLASYDKNEPYNFNTKRYKTILGSSIIVGLVIIPFDRATGYDKKIRIKPRTKKKNH